MREARGALPFFGVLVALAMIGCDGGGDDGGLDQFVLRPGVTRVWTSEVVPAGAHTRSPPRILDLARHGDEIVLLYEVSVQPSIHTSSQYVVAGMLRTEDGGLTWTDYPSVRNVAGTGDTGTGYSYPYAIFFREGALYALWLYEGDRSHRHAVHSVSFAEGEALLELVAGNLPAIPLSQLGDELGELTSYPSGPETITYDFRRGPMPHELNERQVEQRPSEQADSVGCSPLNFRLSPDASGWTRWRLAADCFATHPTTGERLWCIETILPDDSLLPSRGCVPNPSESLPGAPFRFQRSFRAAGLSAYIFEGEGPPVVARILGFGAEARLDVLPLGPGELPNNGWSLSLLGRQRDRYADLLPLVERLPENATRTTLYRFSTAMDGFVPSGLPVTPCEPGAPCGFRPLMHVLRPALDTLVDWAEPLGDGEYLLFYVLDEMVPSSEQHRFALFMSRERVAMTGARTPAGPLERACMLESVCRDSRSVSGCIEEGLTMSRAPGTPDARFEARLAATSCADLMGAHHGEACAPGSPAVCRGDDVYVCNGSGLERSSECARYGQTCGDLGGSAGCVAPACTEGEPSCSGALGCGGGPAEGQDCGALGYGCALVDAYPYCVRPSSACSASSGWVCEGDRAVPCVGPGTAGTGELDCARLPGFGCRDGACVPLAPGCDPGTPYVCEGDTLVYCHAGSWRELDCASVGGRCESGTRSAICVAR